MFFSNFTTYFDYFQLSESCDFGLYDDWKKTDFMNALLKLKLSFLKEEMYFSFFLTTLRY
jgi:hypothetical protein